MNQSSTEEEEGEDNAEEEAEEDTGLRAELATPRMGAEDGEGSEEREEMEGVEEGEEREVGEEEVAREVSRRMEGAGKRRTARREVEGCIAKVCEGLRMCEEERRGSRDRAEWRTVRAAMAGTADDSTDEVNVDEQRRGARSTAAVAMMADERGGGRVEQHTRWGELTVSHWCSGVVVDATMGGGVHRWEGEAAAAPAGALHCSAPSVSDFSPEAAEDSEWIQPPVRLSIRWAFGEHHLTLLHHTTVCTLTILHVQLQVQHHMQCARGTPHHCLLVPSKHRFHSQSSPRRSATCRRGQIPVQ